MGFEKIEEICLSEIKQEGKKIKITKNLKEYFEKYTKDGSVEYHEIGFIEEPKLMYAKSTFEQRQQ